MPNPLVSEIQSKQGDVFDIAAKRFSGNRTVTMTGDVTASESGWNGSGELSVSTTIANNAVTTTKIADKAVTTAKIDDGAVGLTQIDSNAMNGTVQDNDSNLATHAAVKTYVDSQISGQGTYLGKHTVAEINAFTTSDLHNGDRVMVSDSGTINLGPGGAGFDVVAGEDLILYKSGSTVQWDSMDGNFKTKQTAVSKTGSALKTITSLTQNANGEVDATFSDIQDGTTSQKGVVQLMDSHTSTATDKAATPNSVKEAYDLADGKVSGPSSSTDGDIAVFDGTTGKLIKDCGKKISDLAAATDVYKWFKVASNGMTKIFKVCDIVLPSTTSYNGTRYIFDFCGEYNSSNIPTASGRVEVRLKSNGQNTSPNAYMRVTYNAGYKTVNIDATFKLYYKYDSDEKKFYVVLAIQAGGTTYNGYRCRINSCYRQDGSSCDDHVSPVASQTEYSPAEGFVEETTNVEVIGNVHYARSAVGSSTKPVFVDGNGKVTQCGNSLDSNISGNAETSTKPKSTVLNSSDDLNTIVGAARGDILEYYWLNTSTPANIPVSGSSGILIAVNKGSNAYTKQICFEPGSPRIWVREQRNGTWRSWVQLVESGDITSTYSSTGTSPVNGTAIASALGTLDAEKTSSDGTNVQVKVTEVDGKITAVNVTTDNTASKVANATSGNLAGLDANGNITDSGSKASDFATAAQGTAADSAIQGVKLEGANAALTPDASKVVTIPNAVATGAGETNGLMTAADKATLNSAVQNVKIGNTSIVSNNVATIPAAAAGTKGVVEYMTSQEAASLWTNAWSAAT